MFLTIDYESYFAPDYTLKKLNTIEYVRDERFKAHGVSVKENDSPAYWVSHADIPKFWKGINPAETTVLAHHTYFDGLVTTQQYGCRGFKRWTDTEGLAQFVIPDHDYPKNLESLAKLFKLKGKIKDVLEKTKGIRDLPPDLEKELALYGNQDVELCYQIYQLLAPYMPEREHELLHITLRMGVEPRLHLDEAGLIECERAAANERNELIADSGYTQTQLSSNKQFVEILTELGIEVPMKISPTTQKRTPALGKNDIGFKNLIADYPQFTKLWDGRMAAKSTIHITRPTKFLRIKRSGNGTMPMPLKYCGAHTLRWSGTDGLNVQNLPRLKASNLRRCIIAPPGYVILVIDSSQIECRFNAWLAGHERLLDIFRNGEDVYAVSASDHFGYTVQKDTHPDERQFGKLLTLALGFGMGHEKFRTNSAIGFMGVPPVHMTEIEAFETVSNWRMTNHPIKAMWDYLQMLLPLMTSPNCYEEHNGIIFKHEQVLFPNGRSLHYPNLHATEDGWFYGHSTAHKIYGGLFDENIVQSGARHVVADQILETERQLPYILTVGSTHDEGIFLVPEIEADEALAAGLEIFSTTPDWTPGLPLAAEGGYAKEYVK